MSNKWVSKLTEEEIIKLLRYVFGDCIESIKDLNYDDEDSVSVTAIESGWECDGEDETLESFYEIDDFDGIHIYDWADTSGNKKYIKPFRDWMIKKFGTKYVYELIKEKLDINLEDYLNWSCIGNENFIKTQEV